MGMSVVINCHNRFCDYFSGLGLFNLSILGFDPLSNPTQQDKQGCVSLSALLNWYHSIEDWATHISASAIKTWLNSNLRLALQNSRQINFSFNISFVLDSEEGKVQLCLFDIRSLNPTWQLMSQRIMSNCFFYFLYLCKTLTDKQWK